MKICIDIDGTICETKDYNQDYGSVQIKSGAKRAIDEWKRQGHYIVLYTARHMVTCNNNIGKIIAKQGPILFEWLKRHDIQYDEILFGKPACDVYIDDKALKFNDNWDEVLDGVRKINLQ